MAATDVGIYGLLLVAIGLVITTNVRMNGLAVKVAELRGDLQHVSVTSPPCAGISRRWAGRSTVCTERCKPSSPRCGKS